MLRQSVSLERETGIEPATNSLEGCDSTTELLPPCLAFRESFFFCISGGEGRTRTFEAARATDLQSAAFDRFATSPASCGCGKRMFRFYLRPVRPSTELAKGFEPPTC